MFAMMTHHHHQNNERRRKARELRKAHQVIARAAKHPAPEPSDEEREAESVAFAHTLFAPMSLVPEPPAPRPRPPNPPPRRVSPSPSHIRPARPMRASKALVARIAGGVEMGREERRAVRGAIVMAPRARAAERREVPLYLVVLAAAARFLCTLVVSMGLAVLAILCCFARKCLAVLLAFLCKAPVRTLLVVGATVLIWRCWP